MDFLNFPGGINYFPQKLHIISEKIRPTPVWLKKTEKPNRLEYF